MIANNLIKIRKQFEKSKLVRKIIQLKLLKLGMDLPTSVKIGNNLQLPHNSIGTVIHPNTSIGNNVKIYQNVTIGRADVNIPYTESKMRGIIIEDNVIIGAGAKILCKDDILYIRKGTIIGANAVVLGSTEENGVYVGIPAKNIR